MKAPQNTVPKWLTFELKNSDAKRNLPLKINSSTTPGKNLEIYTASAELMKRNGWKDQSFKSLWKEIELKT